MLAIRIMLLAAWAVFIFPDAALAELHPLGAASHAPPRLGGISLDRARPSVVTPPPRPSSQYPTARNGPAQARPTAICRRLIRDPRYGYVEVKLAF